MIKVLNLYWPFQFFLSHTKVLETSQDHLYDGTSTFPGTPKKKKTLLVKQNIKSDITNHIKQKECL